MNAGSPGFTFGVLEAMPKILKYCRNDRRDVLADTAGLLAPYRLGYVNGR